MNTSPALAKIKEAILNAVKQISELPITASNFQPLNPTIDWDWNPVITGTTSKEQYEFCDHMPQSCKPGVQFSASAKSFSENYQSFIYALAPSFQPEETLKEIKLKLQPPPGNPADTIYVPDGWTKVTDGAGILRWRPDWSISANPRDWVKRIEANSDKSVTIDLTSLVSDESNSNNEQLLKYQSVNGQWYSLSIQPGEVQSILIYAEALGRIAIQPGAWYNSAILGLGKNGPFISNYQSTTFFSDSGLLRCRISEFVVAYKPKLTIHISNSLIERYKELLSAIKLQVAGFIFPKSDINFEPMDDVNRHSGDPISTVPQIIGVFIESFHTCDPINPPVLSQDIKFGDKFYLRNKNGEYIIGADLSWGANGRQYYPRLGNTGKVALEFKGGIANVETSTIIQIKSTEEFVGKYNVLGAWTTPNCYYYSTETTYQQQNWQITKNNSNDAQIRYGDAVYLSNVFYKNQKLVSNGLYLTTKKDADEWWIIEKP
ncbi:hypothetical protein [Nostoc sp. CCY 9925]|uniref:hypothetical protein n=1 Tax=Nostoc sp. CCY 9925 TaxID=3103865 RepID=UPI0039C667D6